MAVNLTAQTEHKRTNLEIFEKNISAELEKLFYTPGIERTAKFIFLVSITDDTKIDEKESKEFITGVIKKTGSKNNINFSIAKDYNSFEADSSYNKFKIRINTLKTAYPKFAKKKFLGEKTLLRKIYADIDADLSLGNTPAKSEKIKVDYTDEIDYDDYLSLETSEYPFTKGRPPGVSDFETIIFPAMLVAVSAAAIILFFTIRSK